MQIRDPQFVYVSNVKARAIRSAVGIATDLANNIAHGVRWHDATSVAQELGCQLFLGKSRTSRQCYKPVRLAPTSTRDMTLVANHI